MIPILYEKDETQFTSNGIGFLADAVSCFVTEERNGAYELEMEYPIDSDMFKEILPDRLIKAKAKETGNLQYFRIYSVEKVLGGIASIKAEHVSYRLNYIPVSRIASMETTSVSSVFEALRNSVPSAVENPFTLWSDKISQKQLTFSNAHPTSLRSCLFGSEGSVLDIFGGEYEFDNYDVKLWTQRGDDNGVSIVYGKNLIDINQEENIANAITGFYPFWANDETVVELDNKIITIQEVQEAEGVPAPEPHYSYPRIVTLDLSSEEFDFGSDEESTSDQVPTSAMLYDKALGYILESGLDKPEVSITVSFAALWQTAGYEDIAELERVNLCDMVTVKMEKLGIDVSSKVIKTVYDVLNERYDSIELNRFRDNLATFLTSQQEQMTRIANDSITGPRAKKFIRSQTDWINGAKGGYVYFERDKDGKPTALIWTDTEDVYDEHANVFIMNNRGIGFSSSGRREDAELDYAWTSDGRFSADYIKTGRLMSYLGTFELDISDKTFKIMDTRGVSESFQNIPQAYDADTVYYAEDGVIYGGKLYKCKKDSPNILPTSDENEYWIDCGNAASILIQYIGNDDGSHIKNHYYRCSLSGGIVTWEHTELNKVLEFDPDTGTLMTLNGIFSGVMNASSGSLGPIVTGVYNNIHEAKVNGNFEIQGDLVVHGEFPSKVTPESAGLTETGSNKIVIASSDSAFGTLEYTTITVYAESDSTPYTLLCIPQNATSTPGNGGTGGSSSRTYNLIRIVNPGEDVYFRSSASTESNAILSYIEGGIRHSLVMTPGQWYIYDSPSTFQSNGLNFYRLTNPCRVEGLEGDEKLVEILGMPPEIQKTGHNSTSVYVRLNGSLPSVKHLEGKAYDPPRFVIGEG